MTAPEQGVTAALVPRTKVAAQALEFAAHLEAATPSARRRSRRRAETRALLDNNMARKAVWSSTPVRPDGQTEMTLVTEDLLGELTATFADDAAASDGALHDLRADRPLGDRLLNRSHDLAADHAAYQALAGEPDVAHSGPALVAQAQQLAAGARTGSDSAFNALDSDLRG